MRPSTKAPQNSSARPTWAVLIAVAGLVSGCGGSGDASSTARPKSSASADASKLPPYLGPLTFGWTAGCDVDVHEIVEKNERKVELDYIVRTVDDLEGRGMKVSFEDLHVALVDGKKIAKKDQAEFSASFRLPEFVVSDAGAIVEIIGMEKLFESLKKADPAAFKTLTPQMIDLVRESVGSKYWDSWAGTWAGVESIDAPILETTTDLPVGDDSVQQQLEMSSLRRPTADQASLKLTVTLDGEDFLRSIGSVMGSLGAPEGAPSDFTALDSSRVVTITASTDPLTLKPDHVTFENNVKITSDGKAETKVETRDWVFDWKNVRCSQK
jgi:hypothetical protein